MKLYVVRHGIAVDRADPSCPPDPDRPLTAMGRERTKQAAEGFARLAPGRVELWSSPYLRARQTAEIFRRVLRGRSSSIQLVPWLLPEADPRQLHEQARLQSGGDWLVVGHMPHLSRFLSYATTGASSANFELKKAGVACLEYADDAGRHATLRALYPAKILRRLSCS